LGNKYAIEILKWFGNEYCTAYFMLSASLSFVLLMENSVKGICSIVHNILLECVWYCGSCCGCGLKKVVL
jgi:hypothetical protein